MLSALQRAKKHKCEESWTFLREETRKGQKQDEWAATERGRHAVMREDVLTWEAARAEAGSRMRQRVKVQGHISRWKELT